MNGSVVEEATLDWLQSLGWMNNSIRLVQDFDVDRRNNDFILKCLHSVLVRLPGSEREAPKHFRFQRRIHQLLRDDQLLVLGCGVGARVFEHGKELLRIR
jgi:hypothetical protein